MFHVICSRVCVVCMKITICQDVIYFLSSRLHCPSNLLNFCLLSSHNVLIAFFLILHSAVVAWIILGQLKSWIRLKLVDLYVADCWRWVPWWLLLSLMKSAELCLTCWFLKEVGSLGVARLFWQMSVQFYHNIFLSYGTLEKKVFGDIVDNRIPVFGWFCVLRSWTVVYFIALE